MNSTLKYHKWQPTRVPRGQKFRYSSKCCAKVCFNPSDYVGAGARHTIPVAVDLPVSEVFSRPEFMVLGVGSAYPQGRQQVYRLVSIPHVHSAGLDSHGMVFVSPVGAETMTTVNTTTTPQAATLGNTLATKLDRLMHIRITKRRYPALALCKPTTVLCEPLTDTALIQAQVTIENALSMALYLVRNQQSPHDLQEATAKAIRACTLLKRQCEQLNGTPQGLTASNVGRA